jgi:hypothetical protein
MAQIDLRHADFYIKDGYAASGTINQPGGYPNGTTTIVVAGFNLAIPNGSTFKINGTGTTYTISGTSGGSTPTSLTFSPGFSGHVADGAAVNVSITGPTVNNVSGYSSGATTMLVTGYSNAIPNGTTFTVAGDVTVHTVSSTVGGSTPTSITFSPALGSNVSNGAQITLTPAGTVNSPTNSPQAGDTSITVSGFSKAIPVGAVFTISGDTTQYTITSVTGGGTPTAFTFTPALVQNEPDTNVVTVGPNILKLKIGEGNVTFEEKRNIEYVREKRQVALGFVKTGDDEPMDVSIDLIWEFLSSQTGEPPKPEEALNQTGAAADWVTAGADPCEPYAVNIEIVYTPPCSGVDAEVILLDEYRWESISHDSKAGTMSTKGKCKALLANTSRVLQPATP